MIVKVSQDHIDKGLVYNKHYCPVALAIQEATGNPGYSVGVNFAWDENII